LPQVQTQLAGTVIWAQDQRDLSIRLIDCSQPPQIGQNQAPREFGPSRLHLATAAQQLFQLKQVHRAPGAARLPCRDAQFAIGEKKEAAAAPPEKALAQLQQGLVQVYGFILCGHAEPPQRTIQAVHAAKKETLAAALVTLAGDKSINPTIRMEAAKRRGYLSNEIITELRRDGLVML
jgi:hypothetical protein